MKAIGYIRVSTSDQEQNGHGLNAQREAIGAAATLKGWEFVDIVEEAGSGKNVRQRPKLEAALARLKAGEADALVVAKLDRLSRSLRDFATILDRSHREGWSVVVLDLSLDLTTPMGEAMANMLMTFAQLERRMIGQRTKDALAEAKRSGVKLGGYRNGAGGSAPRVNARASRRILREAGRGRSLRAIARDLNEDGVPTAHGGREWHPGTVRNVLRRG